MSSSATTCLGEHQVLFGVQNPCYGWPTGLSAAKALGFTDKLASQVQGLETSAGQEIRFCIASDPPELAFANFGTVTLSRRLIHALWRTSAMFMVHFRGRLANLKTGNDAVDDRMESLLDAHQAWIHVCVSRDFRVSTNHVCISRSEREEIDNVFLHSVAWVVLHEHAHLTVEPGSDAVGHELEMQMDSYATAEMAAWPTSDLDDGLARRLGQLVAVYVLMCATGGYNVSTPTHPMPLERLRQCVDLFCLDPTDLSYLVIGSIAQADLLADGHDPPPISTFESMKAYWEWVANALDLAYKPHH